MNVTKSIMQVKQNRRIRISKNAIFTNGIFFLISQDKTFVSAGRSMRYVEVDEVKNLKVLADRSSIEVFVNDGEYVFSTRYYPENHKLLAEAVEA